MSTDLIRIADLELRTRIGISADERGKPQKILCTLEIVTDFSRAAHTDDIADTINAQEVANRVRELASAQPRHLVERLAEEIADCLLKEFRADRVSVSLKKFVLAKAANYGVHIERERNQ